MKGLAVSGELSESEPLPVCLNALNTHRHSLDRANDHARISGTKVVGDAQLNQVLNVSPKEGRRAKGSNGRSQQTLVEKLS